VDSPRLPTVTCVITAYNVERFVAAAIESALGQDYPAELLDVVVVNDGSTDATPRVLDRYRDHPRVTVIDQPNGGVVAASSRALGAATGELIGILDGDDTWPADRLRLQVPVLMDRPEVGLVHGDMEIVDTEGRVLNPSFFAYSRFAPPQGRVLGPLLRQNFVSNGSVLVRSSLRERFHPIPDAAIFQDWWLAAAVAGAAEIAHVDASTNRYCMHGANLGLGGTGEKFFLAMQDNVRCQRYMLRMLDTSTAAVPDLHVVCETILANALRAAAELRLDPAEVLPVTDAERSEAAALRARAAALPADAETVARTYVRAFALDPWSSDARAAIAEAAQRAEGARRQAEAIEARTVRVLAFAAELSERPDLLRAYAATFSAADDVTLLIHAPAGTLRETAVALGPALEAAGLDGDDGPDLVLYDSGAAADLLGAGPIALYSERPAEGELGTLRRCGPHELSALNGRAALPITRG
jgi:hypothetical protein